MLILAEPERRKLRARAHALNPTVMIGSAGLTEAVLKEIAASLSIHELIKIKVLSDDRVVREAMLDRVCDQLNAAPIQHIGKILVVYQPNPEAHKIEIKKMPRHKGRKPLTKKQLGNR
jgi:RNA-binding protein